MYSVWKAPPSMAPVADVSGTAYDFEFISIDGAPMRLADWRGRALLIVNSASLCGFTKQYAGLQELYLRYETSGLVVIAVPSNDFGEQEPSPDGEIQSFCQGVFGVTFPLTSKHSVVGPDAHPFYKWAAEAMGPTGVPAWNFHKYLIGRDGRLLRSFPPKVTPTAPEIITWIEKALEKSSGPQH
ncbi:glutathione peroxidase [Hyphomicrobium sp.]|uniref:glutathione peroxidase n=1 Tax=Hyphomicrobium sp. TaxID=82 RepID=UPI002D76CC68|nr:glutathione peroxidase [Hyphomicrobium sp.]